MDNTLGRITPSPSVTDEKEHEYQGLIKYLGLEDYMGYSQARFAAHHSHILLSQDALTASIKPVYDTAGRSAGQFANACRRSILLQAQNL